jgi:penicillin amidase
MLYADVDGHIGYQAPGLIPIRGNGDGLTPAPGWAKDYRWKGFIPFAELPYTLDPPEGYIVTANNAVVDDLYPHPLAQDWSYGYRSQRLLDLIATSDQLTVETMANLQRDDLQPFAEVLVPILLETELDGDAAQAQGLLRDWDYRQSAGSAGAAYFNASWRHLLAETFHDELPGDLRPDGSERWFEVMRNLLQDPFSRWWDDLETVGQLEFRSDILSRAQRAATAELQRELGDDPAKWRWGDLHTLELTSGTFGESGITPLEMLFNRGPVATAGGDGLVNATGWTAYEGYEVDWAPSMRMVVDLSDLDASRWIQVTGQSGHIFDPHYWDQNELWRAGDTLPWAFTQAAVQGLAEEVLVMTSDSQASPDE